MRAGRFFWKLFVGHAALVALVLGACLWLVVARFERIHDQESTADLRRWASALRALVENRFDAAHSAELDSLAKAMGASNPEGVRITLVSNAGVVLADSQAETSRMDSHADRPEIRQALEQGWGESVRWSDTVSRELKYVALRVGEADHPLGCIRVAMGMQTIAAHDASVRRLVWTIGLVGLVGALALALGLSVLWSGRILRLTATAHRLARGDLAVPIGADGSDEVSLLARSLERMRDRLRRQLTTIEHQGRTWESLLAQLHEGVVVSDPDGRIVLMNPAAVRFLGLTTLGGSSRAALSGGSVKDHIRNPALRGMLLTDAITAGGEDEKRLEIQSDDGVLSILARASEIALPGPGDGVSVGEPSGWSVAGRLLVLADITELTRAMQVRSDFVANASHELRTPISAIRAAVDTVLKIDVAKEAQQATRFLSVIARHTLRLEALVGDLLDLSRLENPTATFQPEVLRLQRLCDELHNRWESEINAKKLRWRSDITDNCPNVFANPYLLTLVLDNLVDNAVKFTDHGGQIGVGCHCGEASVEIEVFDTGCGMAAHEHQRVFERFYQVESARSHSRARGTGLGLSIVKHAVAAMGGSVYLDSAPGRGTRVTVQIPNQQHSVTQS